MKKRQIKKNSKKIADKLTGYASVVKELEALGVFSIDPNWRGEIECHMRPENIVKLPFTKSVGFKFSEFDKDHIQASVKFSGFTFFALVNNEERTKYFPGELDVQSYE
ncbi:TPA: hypothetical protein QFD37_002312 [Enterococcus faecium]